MQYGCKRGTVNKKTATWIGIDNMPPKKKKSSRKVFVPDNKNFLTKSRTGVRTQGLDVWTLSCSDSDTERRTVSRGDPHGVTAGGTNTPFAARLALGVLDRETLTMLNDCIMQATPLSSS